MKCKTSILETHSRIEDGWHYGNGIIASEATARLSTYIMLSNNFII